MTGGKVVKVKIKAYPIPVQLTGGPAPLSGKILRLSANGFVADMLKQIVHVNEKFTAQFEIPKVHAVVSTPVVVFRTNDHIVQVYSEEQKKNVGTEIIRVTEFHFKNLDADDLIRIEQFMKAIGQSE